MLRVRRAIVAVAVCGLLAGCSGQAGPTALDRSICQQVKRLPYVDASMNGPSQRGYALALMRSGDPVFGRLASDHADYMTWRQHVFLRCSELGI
jgi:hypothetical protein